MTDRIFGFGLAVLVALTTAAFELPAAHGAESGQKVARLGFVSPFSPSSDVRSVDGFWQRLRELGWVDITGKWLQLLHEEVPRLSTVAVLENPDYPLSRGKARELEAVAPTLGVKLLTIEVRHPEDLDRALGISIPESILLRADEVIR